MRLATRVEHLVTLFKRQMALKSTVTLAAALWLGLPGAWASPISGLKPELESSSWQEGTTELASVSLNGKELITFSDQTASGQAEARAQDLTEKLQLLLNDKKFDANSIMPGKTGELSAINRGGTAMLSFDAAEPGVDKEQSALKASLKLVNGLRQQYGAPLLPSSVASLMEHPEQKLADDQDSDTSSFSGQASWYGGRFHGRKTSDGHQYDQEKLTAAHRSLPFGTKLLVKNRKTGNTCVVEINDRGPFVGDRVIDLSRAAARQLDIISSGVALVDCFVLGSQ